MTEIVDNLNKKEFSIGFLKSKFFPMKMFIMFDKIIP